MKNPVEIINDMIALKKENDYNKFMEYCGTLSLEELTALRAFAASTFVFADCEIMRINAVNQLTKTKTQTQ